MSRGPEQLRLSPDERADLVAYVDGELPEGVSRSLSTKLTHSGTGRLEVEMLKKTWELLGYLPLPAAPPDFADRTVTEIRRRETRSPAWDPRVKTWTAQDRLCRGVPGAGGSGPWSGVCRYSLVLAGSVGTPESRPHVGRASRRVPGGWLVRLLETTRRFARIPRRCSLTLVPDPTQFGLVSVDAPRNACH